jgi:hypothetical protein
MPTPDQLAQKLAARTKVSPTFGTPKRKAKRKKKGTRKKAYKKAATKAIKKSAIPKSARAGLQVGTDALFNMLFNEK